MGVIVPTHYCGDYISKYMQSVHNSPHAVNIYQLLVAIEGKFLSWDLSFQIHVLAKKKKITQL